MHGMYRTLEAELEVQRTIKRADLTDFLCFIRKAIGLTIVHVDNKWIIDGLRRRRKEVHLSKSEGRRFVDHERSSSRHTGGGRARQSASLPLLDKFIPEGSEKADERAKEGAMMDGGLMAQVRASTVQQEREEL